MERVLILCKVASISFLWNNSNIVSWCLGVYAIKYATPWSNNTLLLSFSVYWLCCWEIFSFCPFLLRFLPAFLADDSIAFDVIPVRDDMKKCTPLILASSSSSLRRFAAISFIERSTSSSFTLHMHLQLNAAVSSATWKLKDRQGVTLCDHVKWNTGTRLL